MISSGETLCLACGLCCNGTLHNFTALSPGEYLPAQRLGLHVREHPDGQVFFLQPCAAFQDPMCTVYAQRPRACQEYQCKLLQSLVDGSLELAEALETVRRVKLLIIELRGLMAEADEQLTLDQQVRINWPAAQPLPVGVQPVFDELANLLRVQYGVRWRRQTRRVKR